jgi:hypothetical protein
MHIFTSSFVQHLVHTYRIVHVYVPLHTVRMCTHGNFLLTTAHPYHLLGGCVRRGSGIGPPGNIPNFLSPRTIRHTDLMGADDAQMTCVRSARRPFPVSLPASLPQQKRLTRSLWTDSTAPTRSLAPRNDPSLCCPLQPRHGHAHAHAFWGKLSHKQFVRRQHMPSPNPCLAALMVC